MVIAPQKVLAAEPGCYKISDGEPVKLNCPTTNVAYDDGNGGNISRPNSSKCYIYSANLYDGDSSYGDPYVQVNCSSLSACPSGQELRYSDNSAGDPTCVNQGEEVSGQYAGGAKPANTSGSLYDSYAEPSSSANDCKDSSLDRSNCGIVRYLVFFINILSAVVGIVVTGTIIMGGIQYSTSGGDPSKIQAAKKRVFNGIFALIAFIFSYAFLQYIVPGGVL